MTTLSELGGLSPTDYYKLNGRLPDNAIEPLLDSVRDLKAELSEAEGDYANRLMGLEDEIDSLEGVVRNLKEHCAALYVEQARLESEVVALRQNQKK